MMDTQKKQQRSKYHPDSEDGPVGYDTLGMAVICRAAEDYRINKKKLLCTHVGFSQYEEAKHEVDSCARFFESDWMTLLAGMADIDGLDIQARLDREVRIELEKKKAIGGAMR